MKLKLKQIWASQQAMPKLLNREIDNVKASFFIARNARVLDVEFDALNLKRIELVKRMGVEDPANKQWSIPNDKMEEFNKKFEDLLDREVEIPIEPIAISWLAGCKLSPMDCASIDFMLYDEE